MNLFVNILCFYFKKFIFRIVFCNVKLQMFFYGGQRKKAEFVNRRWCFWLGSFGRRVWSVKCRLSRVFLVDFGRDLYVVSKIFCFILNETFLNLCFGQGRFYIRGYFFLNDFYIEDGGEEIQYRRFLFRFLFFFRQLFFRFIFIIFLIFSGYFLGQWRFVESLVCGRFGYKEQWGGSDRLLFFY